MGPGADAADVADRPGHFLHGPAFAEFFEAAQGLDMHLGVATLPASSSVMATLAWPSIRVTG